MVTRAIIVSFKRGLRLNYQWGPDGKTMMRYAITQFFATIWEMRVSQKNNNRALHAPSGFQRTANVVSPTNFFIILCDQELIKLSVLFQLGLLLGALRWPTDS